MNNPKDFPYNQVCFKASHNSYEMADKGISLPQQIAAGCRGLELDISQSPDGQKWSVEHSDEYSADPAKQLAKYLAELKQWSNDNSGHDVITIHVDLKHVNDHSSTSTFPDALDQYIQSNFDSAKIYCPGNLMGQRISLADGAKTNGWPKLQDLDGKFIFCLTGDDVLSLNQLAKKHYAQTEPKARLCFTDLRKRPGEQPNPGKRVYFNYNFKDRIGQKSNKKWTKIIEKFAGRNDVITRTFSLNDSDKWERALKSKFNILVTDEIDKSWAKVNKTNAFKIL